jgi:type IV secretory pathway protease TraF
MRGSYPVATRKPTSRSRRVVPTVWGASALIAASALGAYVTGLRVNATVSMPLGLWRLEPVPGSLRTGEIVVFCPPDSAAFREALDRGYVARGACPGGHRAADQTGRGRRR